VDLHAQVGGRSPSPGVAKAMALADARAVIMIARRRLVSFIVNAGWSIGVVLCFR
jgi:copper homeostasis protein CutC